MQRQRRVKKPGSISTRRLIWNIVIGTLIVLGAISTVQLWGKQRQVRALRNEVRTKHENLVHMREDLEQSLEDLEGEEGLERTIRENFRVVQEGEEIVVLITEEALQKDE